MARAPATATDEPTSRASNRPIKEDSLVARTVQTLGRSIIHGTWLPEQLLPPEGEIAKSIGVGRNVVREATKILSAKGLVRIAQGSGTRVQPESDWNYFDSQVIGWALESDQLRDALVDELSTLRAIVEPEVAALAAASGTTTDVLRLFEAFEQMEDNLNNPDRAVEADILFHRRLFQASHNRMLMGFLRTVISVMRINFQLAIKVDHAILQFLEEHREVAEAVQRRDPDEARAAMQRLLANNKKNLAQMRQLSGRRTRPQAGRDLNSRG